MAIDYGLWGVPETFIIDAQGIVRHKEIGAVTDVLLRNWIDSLMPRVNPADTAVRKSP
jgi:cytochrome c biogenesis protein CcmG/thiol:disulfide interchange protein DsbE